MDLDILFQCLGAGVIVADASGRILRFNPEAERLLGPGASAAELLAADGVTRLSGREQLLVRLAAGETFDDLVLYARRPDSLEGRFLRATGRPLPTRDGQAQGGVAVLHDVTGHQRYERRIAVQQAVSQILAEVETLSEAAPRIMSAICKSAGWDLGSLWRINRETAVLCCVDVWLAPGVHAQQFEQRTRSTSFASGAGLPGRVWASGKPAWITDVTTDSNFPRANSAGHAGLHGAFGFPILLGSETIGVFEFFSREVRSPDDEFLALMQDLGAQIGQFIARKRAEEELEQKHQLLLASEKQLRQQLDLTQQQQQAILELSTPILELWDDALALPIIGAMDAHRSQSMTEQLLSEIVKRHARFVIIDVTGVDFVDTSTADHFQRLIRAVQLLGAQCLLTGVRPAVAQAMVGLGVSLGSTSIQPSLKFGLRECMRLARLAR